MRYIPHTPEEIQGMLKAIGRRSVEELFHSIPENLREEKLLKLPEAMDEMTLLAHLNGLADENNTSPQNRSFLGGGVYRHHIPSAVATLISRSEFATPYTPYQPEIAQGTLQVMFEFQTMVAEIFGMDVANASLYDGSTALAEAVLMALRLAKGRKNILIPTSLHPEYLEVVRTILKPFHDRLVTLPVSANGGLDFSAAGDYLNKDLACVVIPYPNFFGVLEDHRELVAKVHEQGGFVIYCVTEPLSLGLFESPGVFGADIVCGEGQSFGLSPSFGGPFVGLFAAKQEFVRQMPGRLAGMTTDSQGRRGFVLTLSTREQHIRREKATSNICTNQALCATQSAIYLSLLGKEGFRKLATLNWQRAEYAKQQLRAISGVQLKFPKAATFNEFAITFSQPASGVAQELKKQNWEAGIPLERWLRDGENDLLVSVTEKNSREDIDAFIAALKGALRG